MLVLEPKKSERFYACVSTRLTSLQKVDYLRDGITAKIVLQRSDVMQASHVFTITVLIRHP